MAKVLIDIPDEAIERLDVLAQGRDTSRAALIRMALAGWLEEQKRVHSPKEAFGILKDDQAEDSVDVQRKIRGEWK